SSAFLKVGRLDSALYFAKEGESISKTNHVGLPVYMDLIKDLRDVYEARKEMAQALAYDKQYTLLQDSMYRSQLRTKIADAEARFDLTEKNKQLSELSAENELQKVTAQKQQLLNIFLLVVVCLGAVIIVLV